MIATPARPALQRFLALEIGGTRVPKKQMMLFTRRLASLLHSGLTPAHALGVLRRRLAQKALRRVVDQITVRVQSGSTLADAMEEHPRVFPPSYVASVSVGERTGSLDVVLKRMGTALHRTQQVRAKIRSAAIYPAFVLVALGLVGWYMLTRIMPQFASIFADAGVELPAVTRSLLWASATATRLGPGILLVFAGTAMGLARLYARPGIRRATDRYLVKIPVVGPLAEGGAMAQYCRMLSTMLFGGVGVSAAMRMSADTLGNHHIAEAIRAAASDVGAGMRVEEALERTRAIPPEVLSSTGVGETGGTLPEQMELLAEYYEEFVLEEVDTAAKLIEPVLILLVFGLVATLVFGIYLPLFKVARLGA
ncbi:MAG TPA: type II secretion system F family protein [Longimicrobium sp.]|jgi:type II secretory pathway component PulF